MATYEIEHCSEPGEHSGYPLVECPVCMEADRVVIRWTASPKSVTKQGMQAPLGPVGHRQVRDLSDNELIEAFRPYIFGGGALEPDFRWLAQELFWRLSAKTEPRSGN